MCRLRPVMWSNNHAPASEPRIEVVGVDGGAPAVLTSRLIFAPILAALAHTHRTVDRFVLLLVADSRDVAVLIEQLHHLVPFLLGEASTSLPPLRLSAQLELKICHR